MHSAGRRETEALGEPDLDDYDFHGRVPMAEILSSPWMTFVQAILCIIGTWLLAFGLKSVREAGKFDTSNPQPLSYRFWVGLILLTLSLIPPLVSPFMPHRDQIQSKSIETEAFIIGRENVAKIKSVDQK